MCKKYHCHRAQSAPKCTSKHPYLQKFSGGACPQTPLAWAAYAAKWASPTLGTPLLQILNPPLNHTGDCLSLSSAPTPLVCTYVSVFVEKGLSPSGSKLRRYLLGKYQWLPSTTRRITVHTVHRWNSLLRFRFLLGSETQ